MDNNISQLKSKKGIFITIVIILIIVVVLLAMVRHSVIPEASSDVITSSVPATTPGASTKSSTVISSSLSYKDALEKYQEKIVRITNDCSTEKMTFSANIPVGQQVMIANDSIDKSHIIAIEGMSYTLAPQHYKVITIQEMGVVSTSCNPNTGVTTVVITPAQ